MKQVAPMPPACPNWTGFYVGAFGGYKFAATDINLNLGGLWNGPNPIDVADRDAVNSQARHDLDTSGAEAGGLIGYNYQWNKWVLGAEAAGGYLWLRNSDETDVFGVNFPRDPDTYSVATSFKTHYLFTAAPRIGYAFCHWLPYVTGGLALADVDFQQDVIQHNLSFRNSGRTDDTHVGWMVGGGLEYALTDHWRLRGQYQYIDLGNADYHTVGDTGAGYTSHPSINVREHNASVALIFGF